MADSMPAVSAQTPLQPGAARGSSLVTPNTPVEFSQPSMPSPAGGGPSTGAPGGGSANTMGWTGMNLMTGIHNGGQAQGQRTNQAWPIEHDGAVRAADAGQGSQLDMDVRCIDVPAAPHCSQSTGSGVGAINS